MARTIPNEDGLISVGEGQWDIGFLRDRSQMKRITSLSPRSPARCDDQMVLEAAVRFMLNGRILPPATSSGSAAPASSPPAAWCPRPGDHGWAAAIRALLT